MSNSTAIVQHRENSVSPFSSAESFELIQRVSNAFVKSNLVPAIYKENIGNCIIAVELANRVGASPLMVMQNLHVIEGRPSWSSKFVIAALNQCGKFSPLRFRIEDIGIQEVSYDVWSGPKDNRSKSTKTEKIANKSCVAWSVEKETGEVLEGPAVTMAMAVAEGWFTKAGSKWKTMPDLMLRYRAASFFGNLYAPEILMGMPTDDELIDISPREINVTPPSEQPAAADDLNQQIAANAAKKKQKAKAPTPVVIETTANDVDDPADHEADEADETADDGQIF
jgi:hypothetical protein